MCNCSLSLEDLPSISCPFLHFFPRIPEISEPRFSEFYFLSDLLLSPPPFIPFLQLSLLFPLLLLGSQGPLPFYVLSDNSYDRTVVVVCGPLIDLIISSSVLLCLAFFFLNNGHAVLMQGNANHYLPPDSFPPSLPLCCSRTCTSIYSNTGLLPYSHYAY